MLRASLSRYAQRLGGMVSALPIVLSAGAHAGSILQINHAVADDGLTCCAGAVAHSPADSLSVTGTIIGALENAAPSSDAGDNTDHQDGGEPFTGVTPAFINCTGSGRSSQFRTESLLRETLKTQRADAGDDDHNHARTFAFSPGSADAANLTAMDFREGAAFDLNFMVRFHGFDEGASDKVTAMVVPLPPAIALGAVGLLGAIIVSRRLTPRLTNR